jgi:hypothetical protein
MGLLIPNAGAPFPRLVPAVTGPWPRRTADSFSRAEVGLTRRLDGGIKSVPGEATGKTEPPLLLFAPGARVAYVVL